MCVSKGVSYGAFIIGLTFSVILLLRAIEMNWMEMALLAIAIQSIVIVQLFEAMRWSGNTWWGSQGIVTIILVQPIIIGMILLMLPQNPYIRVIVTMILILYSVYVVASLNMIPPQDELPIPDDCGHIVYTFSGNLPLHGIPYLIALTVVLVLLVSPDIGLLILTLELITIFTAKYVYPCGFGSMWCLFAVILPLALLTCMETGIITH